MTQCASACASCSARPNAEWQVTVAKRFAKTKSISHKNSQEFKTPQGDGFGGVLFCPKQTPDPKLEQIFTNAWPQT